MKTIYSYTSSIPQAAPGVYGWNPVGKSIKDITLSNSFTSENEVSEVVLNIKGFSAIDMDGNEHVVDEFRNQKAVHLFGIPSGKFIRTRSFVKLAPGTYIRLRFHLADIGGRYIYSDGTLSPIWDQPFIEFDCEKPLEIREGEQAEFLLRFDFHAYELKRIWNAVADFFLLARLMLTSKFST